MQKKTLKSRFYKSKNVKKTFFTSMIPLSVAVFDAVFICVRRLRTLMCVYRYKTTTEPTMTTGMNSWTRSRIPIDILPVFCVPASYCRPTA